jgi:polyhydroxybutyrate depolymerase
MNARHRRVWIWPLLLTVLLGAVPLGAAPRPRPNWRKFRERWKKLQKEHQQQQAQKFTGKPGTYKRVEITAAGVKRRFRLFVPDFRPRIDRLPLVFVFHGLGGNGTQVAAATKFEDLAKDQKFMVCCPDAIDGKWAIARSADTRKDIEFIRQIVSRIHKAFPLNRYRIYATGMSMGAYFCHHLANAKSKWVAAIAPHSGGLGTLAATGITAKRKYPVLLIHGEQDRIVSADHSRTAKAAYEKAGHTVRLRVVEGLGHAWATEQDITKAIWRFFQQHPLGWRKPTATPTTLPAGALGPAPVPGPGPAPGPPPAPAPAPAVPDPVAPEG